MLTTRVQITDHAAQRYVDRIDRTMPIEQARKLLEELAPTAAPLKKKTLMGQDQWKLEHPVPCVLVVKWDNDFNLGRVAVVVTVMDLPSAPSGTESDEERAMRIADAQVIQARRRKPNGFRKYRHAR